MSGSTASRAGLSARRTLLAALLASTALAGAPARAQDATWLAAPSSGDMTDGVNWSSGALPTGTATFGASTITSLTQSGVMDLGGWTFASGAPAYAITTTGITQFTGAGIVVNGAIPTLTNAGIMLFGNAASAGSAAIINRGTLQFENSASAGSATITNTSATYFYGSSTAGSAVIANNGVLSFSEDSTAGSAAITSRSDLFFHGNSTAGTAAITNHVFVLFQGLSTAGSATITNKNTILFQELSTAGNAVITNDGGLNFFGSSTAGTATITNNGAINFLDASTAGSAVITNAGTLSFLSSTGNATITSTGAVGLSSTDMTGAATVTIENRGSLRGTGSVGNTTIQAGGTLAPADGTLRINGNLTLAGGATYAFAPTGLTSVTGTASLDGKLQFRATGFTTQSYTVLTAVGGISGSFALEALYGAVGQVIYGTNDVTLVVDGYKAVTALGGQGTGNTGSVASAIDRGIDAASGSPPAAFNALLNYSGANLANAMNRLSGEAATGAQSTAFSTASTFLGIMLDPMAGARSATASAPGSSLIEMADTGMTPAARVAAGWSVWTKAFGQAGRSASDAGTGAAGTPTTVFGVAAGADRPVSPNTLVGFALAGGGTAFGLGQRGSGTGEYLQLGLYGSTRLGEGYLSAAIAYGWNRFDVSRRAGLGPLETYTSSPVAHTFGSRIEAGQRFGSRAFAVTPYAAIEAIGYASAAYQENWTAPANGAFALAYAARTTGTVRTEAGLRIDSMRAIAPTADLLTFGRIAYAWQSGTQRAADAAFQQLANSGFTVFGARASTHTMLATLGTEVRLATGTRATASIDGELGDRHRSIRANVGLSHSW